MATPHSGSVAGSLTDDASSMVATSVTGSLTDASSTVPESVANDSVTDMMAASDTDASDSGIFSRYNNRGSRRDIRKTNSRNSIVSSKLFVSEKDSVAPPSPKSAFSRTNKTPLGSKEDLRSSGRQKSKHTKHSANVPSGNDKPKQDNKLPVKDLINKLENSVKISKSRVLSEELSQSNIISRDRPLFIGNTSSSKAIEVDPYNTFYNKKISPKHLSKISNLFENTSWDLKGRTAQEKNSPKYFLRKEQDLQKSSKQNPYISPLISSIGRREIPTRPSLMCSSPPPSSVTSGLRSPSLISSSSTASLPCNRKESVFSFPRQTNTLAADRLPTFDTQGSNSSYLFQRVIPSMSPEKSNRSTPSRTWESNSSSSSPAPRSDSDWSPHPTEKYSSPIDGFRYKNKPIAEIDLHREGSHIDLVASCEKYLQEEQLNHPSDDDDSTLASTRRSSVSSLSSAGGARRRRRLSSIPLDDDLTIAEEDLLASNAGENIQTTDKSTSQKNASSHEMAIFSAIAALSQVGSVTSEKNRFSGDYEGCFTDRTPAVDESHAAVVVPTSTSTSSRTCNTMPSGTALAANTEFVASGTMPRTDLTSASSSLLDKCVSRVKTLIKK